MNRKHKVMIFILRLFDKNLATKIELLLKNELKIYKPIESIQIEKKKPWLDVSNEEYLVQKHVGKIVGKLFDKKIDNMSDTEFADCDPIFIHSSHFKEIVDYDITQISYRCLLFRTEKYVEPKELSGSKKIINGLKTRRSWGSKYLDGLTRSETLQPGDIMTANEIPVFRTNPGLEVI